MIPAFSHCASILLRASDTLRMPPKSNHQDGHLFAPCSAPGFPETPDLGKVGVMEQTKHPSSKRYPPEICERAVALVLSAIESSGERHGHVDRIARQLDIGQETLRTWVRRPGWSLR